MKRIGITEMENIAGSNDFINGLCGAAAGATLFSIGRRLALGAIRGAISGPVGGVLLVADAACAGYQIYTLLRD